MLRNGVDLISLLRLLSHADLTVIRRYLAQTKGDLQAAHARGSPVDGMH
jgi:site-specific recombinase XerD